jgi:dTDP-4-dehydrorhamnose 3,5-epimerase
MNVRETPFDGVLLLEPKIWNDARGSFVELWQAERYARAGVSSKFMQDNVSFSRKGVLRGLHFQNPNAQGKLVFPLEGQIYDVVVDVRRASRTFGRWFGVTLSSDSKQQIWVPEGFAHGFVVLSETALVVYKCTDTYHAQAEWGVAWDDPDLAIDWPVAQPILSEKDGAYPRLRELPEEALFA